MADLRPPPRPGSPRRPTEAHHPPRLVWARRPTVARRAEKESAPFDLNESLRVVPGRVLVRSGIEIQTVRPRFGVATRVSVIPAHPTVKVRFDRNGQVTKAWIVKSSGYPSVDLPIIASIYRWKAKGKKLTELNRPFEVEIHLILGSR